MMVLSQLANLTPAVSPARKHSIDEVIGAAAVGITMANKSLRNNIHNGYALDLHAATRDPIQSGKISPRVLLLMGSLPT
tara:strand:- start:191 stop:427 length:237 start_codon:yes stop_codon:yes gene_type:complete